MACSAVGRCIHALDAVTFHAADRSAPPDGHAQPAHRRPIQAWRPRTKMDSDQHHGSAQGTTVAASPQHERTERIAAQETHQESPPLSESAHAASALQQCSGESRQSRCACASGTWRHPLRQPASVARAVARPVRTRCERGARRRGRPAGRAGCRPPLGTLRRSTRVAVGRCPSIMPGSGLRQRARVFRRVRAEKTASSAPAHGHQRPAFMRTCTALTLAMSTRPRPMPDWLVATTADASPHGSGARRPPARLAWRPLLGRLDVIVAVSVQHAVAAQDDQLGGMHQQPRLFSAPPNPAPTPRPGFKRPGATDRPRGSSPHATGPSRAWRLARSAASSALTITPSKKASTGAFSAAKRLQRRRV